MESDMLTTEVKEKFLAAIKAAHGENGVVTTRQIKDLVVDLGLTSIPSFIWKNRVGPGMFQIPESVKQTAAAAIVLPFRQSEEAAEPTPTEAQTQFDPNAETTHEYASVPNVDSFFVPFGDFRLACTVVASQEFFPVYISGDSGNGKTVMVEQACAKSKRALTRVQISRETDEDDLIGGFRLIGGETKFVKGPVIRAMELGAVLLLDELDRGDPAKIMCLQGVLEGKPYFIKKTGEIVSPARGFTVMVTANTLGRGAMDSRYSAAVVHDDALLERFPITIAHDFPSAAVETRIIAARLCDAAACSEAENALVNNLVKWAGIIRETFKNGGIEETVSTRRLVHIVNAYRLTRNIDQAIKLCTNRFDTEVQTTFSELWARVNVSETPAPDAPSAEAKAPLY
jgi:cobaltochelatase CobS